MYQYCTKGEWFQNDFSAFFFASYHILVKWLVFGENGPNGVDFGQTVHFLRWKDSSDTPGCLFLESDQGAAEVLHGLPWQALKPLE